MNVNTKSGIKNMDILYTYSSTLAFILSIAALSEDKVPIASALNYHFVGGKEVCMPLEVSGSFHCSCCLQRAKSRTCLLKGVVDRSKIFQNVSKHGHEPGLHALLCQRCQDRSFSPSMVKETRWFTSVIFLTKHLLLFFCPVLQSIHS